MTINDKTKRMLNKLAGLYGLSVHVKPGGDRGGLRGPERGTFWVNWVPTKGYWRLLPYGVQWNALVGEYLQRVVGDPSYVNGNADGWTTPDDKVVEEAVLLMARLQDLIWD
jgi:hypothetical protein